MDKKYECIQKVGGGLSSQVYKARLRERPKDNHKVEFVAVKVIDRRELLKVSAHAEVYLQREIAILRQLDHPNIVRLIEVIDDGTTIYLVTEFCEGGSLREYLDKQKGGLSEGKVFQILSQLVDALKYMYSKSIIHRDLKPHNILLSGDGTVKICDYGFARIYEKQKLMGSILGSPLYMAPEILASNKYTTKCDLFSLGIIMYEMLAGTVPFNTNSAVQLYNSYMRSRNSVIALPLTVHNAVSSECRSLLAALLTVQPEDRITWPDFFQHMYFLSPPPDVALPAPLQPVPSTPRPEGQLSVLAVPFCNRVDINVSDLDKTCLVKLFKMTLANKLQLNASSITLPDSLPILIICSEHEVVEMEDEKPLSTYHNLYSEAGATEGKPRLLFVDIAQKYDYVGEIMSEEPSRSKFDIGTVEGMEKVAVDKEGTDKQVKANVDTLEQDFSNFVAFQEFFFTLSQERYEKCVKYIDNRYLQFTTMKKAQQLLANSLKSLSNLSSTPFDLYRHQKQALKIISAEITPLLHDLKSIVLHDTLKTPTRTSLLDIIGEDAAQFLLAETRTEFENIRAVIKSHKQTSSSAELEVHIATSSEETLGNMKAGQREAHHSVEGLRLYRDHTAKWASVIAHHKKDRELEKAKKDVQDLEWSFVVDGLLEVRAGCSHDLNVASKLSARVEAYFQKCNSSRVSVWDELSSRLIRLLEMRRGVTKSLHALPSLGKMLLTLQTRIDKLNGILALPKVYQAYLHSLHTRFSFDNRGHYLLNGFETLRNRVTCKLDSFKEVLKGSPFALVFLQGGMLDAASLPNLQSDGELSLHDLTQLEQHIDDEFDVIVPDEDVATLVRENAILTAEVHELRQDQKKQDLTVPVVQMLALTAEVENLRNQDLQAKQTVTQQQGELRDLRGKYEELANTLKDRENEKINEMDAFRTKYMQSFDVVRAQAKSKQSEFESRILALEKELADAKREAVQAKQKESLLELKQKKEHRPGPPRKEKEETIAQIKEKDEALLSLQGALNESERACVELKDRISIILNLYDDQMQVNSDLQQKLLQQQQQNPTTTTTKSTPNSPSVK